MAADTLPVLKTRQGCYVGNIERSGVISFKGIPFAQPPVGELRWQPPRPLENSSLTVFADKYPPAPIQPDLPFSLADRLGEPEHAPQSEDCLYLNIWTADLTSPSKAILLWIYGGSYIIGHASRLQSLGERFVEQHPDIVVIACNYRLGIFGSLNLSVLGDVGHPDSCNLNLLDQRAALRWIHDNAAAFGGDPNRITVYGHSAGSNAISHHLASRTSAALFQRAICQSSFLVGHGTVSLDESKQFAKRFFEVAGIRSVKEALGASAARLAKAQDEMFGLAFSPPVCDGRTVMPEELERLAQGEVQGKQFMIGNSTGEYDQLFAGLDEITSRDLVLRRNSRRLKGKEGMLEEYCLRHPEMEKKTALMTANNALGMTYGGELQARVLAKHNDVYKFVFSWADPSTHSRAPHGAPCPFVFGNDVPDSAPTGLENQVRDVWAAFIRSGSPQIDIIPQWNRYSIDGGAVMEIDETWNSLDNYWNADFGFWSPVFPELQGMGMEKE